MQDEDKLRQDYAQGLGAVVKGTLESKTFKVDMAELKQDAQAFARNATQDPGTVQPQSRLDHLAHDLGARIHDFNEQHHVTEKLHHLGDDVKKLAMGALEGLADKLRLGDHIKGVDVDAHPDVKAANTPKNPDKQADKGGKGKG